MAGAFFFGNVTVVHAYNGDYAWWPAKYLEDDLLRLENTGHFTGAETLFNAGMKYFADNYHDIDYIVLLASDTWLVKPEFLENIINLMKSGKKYLATCPWGTVKADNMFKVGMSIDFAVLDAKWTKKSNLFPLRFLEFIEKYSEIFLYHDETIFLERVFSVRFIQSIQKTEVIPTENALKKIVRSYIHRIKEREPIHDERRFFMIKKGRKMYWPDIGLLTHHDPEPKQEILRKLKLEIGEAATRLVHSEDTSYFNHGVTRHAILKDGKKTILNE